jgi:hypothetical protein
LQKRKEIKEMKLFVRLAILVAALLLVANMALAFCDKPICYDIVATEQNGDTYSDYWEVCIYDDGTGNLCSDNAGCYSLYLFGGGPGWFNTSGDATISGKPRYTTWIARGEYESGFLQPIGEGGGPDGYLLTGEGVRETTRYTIQGSKVPCIVHEVEP